jgi:hypothetical protein
MTAIVAQTFTGPYINEGTTPQLGTRTFAAVASGSTHTFPVSTRGTVLMIQNTNATTAVTVTIESSFGLDGRTADITGFSIAAGTRVERKFLPKGWETSAGSGVVNFTVSASGLEVAAVNL